MNRVTVAALAVAAALSLADCQTQAESRQATPTATSAGIVVATARGWTDRGIDGPTPRPGTCHYRNAGGERLPDTRG